MMRYEIVRIQKANHDGSSVDCWTVVEYESFPATLEKCNGGDHHWLQRINAERAQVVYECGLVKHGAPAVAVISVGAGLEP